MYRVDKAVAYCKISQAKQQTEGEIDTIITSRQHCYKPNHNTNNIEMLHFNQLNINVVLWVLMVLGITKSIPETPEMDWLHL